MLHVRCGDDILPRLRTVVPGTAIRWADPLAIGPLAPWPTAEARRQDRAVYLAERSGRPLDRTIATLMEEDAALEAGRAAPEVVLWFEADLFDQIILVYLLQRMAEWDTKRSLVCIGEHPSVARFIGLGQLSAGALAGLFVERRPVHAAEFAAARTVWEALAHGDRTQLERLAREGVPELPFAGEAVDRYLGERPLAGTSLTAAYTVAALRDGACTAGELFQRVQAMERRPWQGDTMFYADLVEMSRGEAPLVTIPDGFPWALPDPGSARIAPGSGD